MKDKEIQEFCKENKIELLILFGSHASEETHPKSDIDVAVKFKRGTEISKLELIYKLDDLFNGKSIDLVVLTTDTDPLLLYEIFFNGRPLYEKDPDIFEKEKLRAWKLYLDTEKLRVIQKQYLKKFAEKASDVA
jgi:predicted nucleotidyltransferase